MPKLLLLFAAFIVSCLGASAQSFSGVVTDTTGKPLAFATIKLGNTRQGLMADLKGYFEIQRNNSFDFITVSHLGFKTRTIDLTEHDGRQTVTIQLVPAPANLEEVVVKSSFSKTRRILNAALANRNRNNPDKYDWYQCHVYYKTIVDGGPDSTLVTDSADREELRQFKETQHLFITETYSKRTWERPEKLQEEILGSRIAGFKKAWFSSLVTDVLPFHAYNDFLKLNGKDYHNPLSNGLYQRFDFRLEDELLQGNDTVWHFSFTPKRNADHLTGSLYISSNRFAITNLKAEHYDKALKRAVGVEQQYRFENDKWFPWQLNYFIRWERIFGEKVDFSLTGTSLIDSVSFERAGKYRFDKAHTTKILPGADELSDTAWKQMRPSPLTGKEHRTYEVIDSIGEEVDLDRIPKLFEKLSEGYLPWRLVDIDLQKIYSFNKYEKHRFGFGLRTSEKVSRRFSVGGWFGYGTDDKRWKYGAWAEMYADRYKEFTFRFSYKNDLQDPGRLQVNRELDKNFLRRFLLGRVDNIQSYTLEVSKRMGYWQTAIAFSKEKVIPQYDYALNHSGKNWSSFNSKEISLSLRYAYAERMSPMLGRYYSSGSKYPILYSRLRFGSIDEDDNRYMHAVAAVKWQKHINRLGDQKYLLVAGGVLSKKPLPLSKLFAGNGFRLDDNALYVFGGMQTMLPYQYYADRFINFYWNHEFDFKFYRLKLGRKFSSTPSPGIGYNLLWGQLKDSAAHQYVQFHVPDPAYHEAGVMINRLLRKQFIGLYYINLNAGYFHHFNSSSAEKRNGRFVFGLSVDL